jgi:PAS domain S-box-containing protein
MFFGRFAERLAGKKPPARYEFRSVTKDKKIVWLEISSKRIIYRGKPAVQAAFTDITMRKQAEEEFAKEHKLLLTIINNLPDLVYVKDKQSRFLLANEALAHSFNLDKSDEVLGKTDFDFAPPELAKQYYTDEQKIFSSEAPLVNHEEFIIDKKTGERRWLLTSKIPFYNEQGELLGLVGLNRDITNRKLAEQALHDISSRQQALLAAIPDIIMEVDKDKVYRWANQAGFNFFGEDVLGKEASYYFEGEQDTYQVVKPLFNGEENIILGI